ncbi:MAG: RusA family crossover junction endodeoxyribonuclease [Calothrix sp. MO_167.B12]|nr:RusA family crossover junction endodeoxyribonuclease [Calothrix sp. MO_167.B12]
MAPRTQQGTVSGAEFNELIVGLSLLAVQPAGNIYIFDIPPHSAQSNHNKNFTQNTQKLTDEIQSQLADISLYLQNADKEDRGSISLKVIFLIGKGEREKDLDNMLKWFLDCFKKATGIDDAAISDLRAIKKRLNYHRGMIGITVKVPSLKNFGDVESVIAMAMPYVQGKTPNTISECIKAVYTVQEQMQNLVKPKIG